MESTGQIIKSARKSLNLTQRDLAKISGISHSNISAIENGKLAIGKQTTEKLATALKLDPGKIMWPGWKK